MIRNLNKALLPIFMVLLLVLIEVAFQLQLFLQNQEFIKHLPQVIKIHVVYYLAAMAVVLPLFIVELLIPNDRKSEDHTHGLIFQVISFQFALFFQIVLLLFVKYFNIKPLINLEYGSMLNNDFVHPFIINISLILISLLFYDFFSYWLHRLQHHSPFFWEFHKTHHAIRNLNSVVSYNHIVELFFQVLFVYLPVSFIIKVDAQQVIILTSFMMAHGHFSHMNSKVNMGVYLRRVISDNYFHRIHHSIEVKHIDKNFANFFTFWDQIFGTAHFPENNEFPETGVLNEPQPRTIKEFLFSPNIRQFFNKK